MYDNHIYSERYQEFKDIIVDILNGDDITTDICELSIQIQTEYDEGRMSSTQYDDLMGYIQDLS